MAAARDRETRKADALKMIATPAIDVWDWDPRGLEDYLFLVLKPVRVQAWRESNEIPGRTLMRDGFWLVYRGTSARD